MTKKARRAPAAASRIFLTGLAIAASLLFTAIFALASPPPEVPQEPAAARPVAAAAPPQQIIVRVVRRHRPAKVVRRVVRRTVSAPQRTTARTAPAPATRTHGS